MGKAVRESLPGSMKFKFTLRELGVSQTENPRYRGQHEQGHETKKEHSRCKENVSGESMAKNWKAFKS